MSSQSDRVRYPAGHLLLRNLHRDYPCISHGEGVYLFDRQGKRYLDGTSGALVASLGHGNRKVVARMAEQLGKVAYVNGLQFTCEPAERLAARLARLAEPLGLSRVCFLTSGSAAVEAAIKFARQLWVRRGQPQRHKLITRTPGYHGSTLYALSASGRPRYRTFFEPLLSPVLTVPAPYPYRCGLQDYAREGAAFYAERLQELIEREDPQTISAFLLETIGGSSTGASLPPPGYFEQIASICHSHGILLIADEILCGTGRTGTFFAAEHYDFRPDLLLLGKGLSGGYAPLSALLVREEHVRTLASEGGSFMHAQTYMQAPCMTAAGLAVLEAFDEDGLLENCRRMGSLLQSRLQQEIPQLPGVGFVTGKGLLAGVELVRDKRTRQPFPHARRIAEGLVRTAFQRGLLLWPNSGSADGVEGDLVLIGPPLIIDSEGVEELVRLLRESLLEFFGDLEA